MQLLQSSEFLVPDFIHCDLNQDLERNCVFEMSEINVVLASVGEEHLISLLRHRPVMNL